MASPREDGELLESSSSSDEENSEEEDSSSGKPGQSAVKFKNDGSFLEMFKKMQESNQQSPQVPAPEKKDVTQLQMKNPDNPSSHADSSHTEKEAVPPQPAQKKPGLMSLVSSSPPDSSKPIQVLNRSNRRFSSSDPKDDILARQSRRFQIQSYC